VVGSVVDLPGAVILRSALKSWHVPVGKWFCSGFVGHGRVLHGYLGQTWSAWFRGFSDMLHQRVERSLNDDVMSSH
jgi:hypothetical protein